MTVLLRIAERVLNRPLLVHPDKVPLILTVLQGRIPIGAVADLQEVGETPPAGSLPAAIGGPLAPAASRFVGVTWDEETNRSLPYRRTKDGVAVVHVLGSLVNRGAWLGASSGMTSYEGIKYQLAMAADDPKARAIVLDIESPGGEAVGAFEAAAAVRAAAGRKPVTAVVNGMAASAAYALASGAGRIVTTETGLAGSIGVVLVHADHSRQLDKEGITPTLIFAGAHKVDGNPFSPLTEPVREDLQREVDQFYDLFVQTVAAGRRSMSPAAIRGTEARVYIGREAVDAGLADAVGTFEEVLADLTRGTNGRASESINRSTTKMENRENAPAAEQPAGIAQAAHEAAVADARRLGRAEGASAERERILGIQAAAFPGQEAMASGFIADGTTTPGAAALAFNAAEKAAGSQHLAAIKAADDKVKVPANPTAGPSPASAAVPQTPEGWKAEWQASPKLQGEFLSAEAYAAYMAGVTAGRVRVLSKRPEAA